MRSSIPMNDLNPIDSVTQAQPKEPILIQFNLGLFLWLQSISIVNMIRKFFLNSLAHLRLYFCSFREGKTFPICFSIVMNFSASYSWWSRGLEAPCVQTPKIIRQEFKTRSLPLGSNGVNKSDQVSSIQNLTRSKTWHGARFSSYVGLKISR